MPAYGEDLAYIHDVGFGHFATRAAPAVLRMLRQSGITKGLVVDLGCGSGIWARELLRAGYDVLGVDISAAMIALARQKAPTGKFEHGSLLRVKLATCDAVTSIGECVNYLFDARNNHRELARFFARAYEALRPGGTFIFDSLEPGQVKGPGPRVRNAEGPDWATLVQADEDTQKRLLTRRITAFRRVGELYRRSAEIHRVRLYEGSVLARELRRAGFRVRMLRGYGPFRLARAHVVLWARKPSI